MRSVSWLLLGVLTAGAAGCGTEEEEVEFVKGEDVDGDGKADSSVEATVLDFEFDGELVTDWAASARSVIQDQLLYSIGHLNGNRSVGRLDRLVLSDIATTQEGGKTHIRYHARMPVAWGSKTNLPQSYDFVLPRDVSYAGLEAFTARYRGACTDSSPHEITSGSMWYYYRPRRSGCALGGAGADADVVRTTAAATVSTVNTTGEYPEYHKVWEDGALEVVAVFGKYEEGATSNGDAGIAAYNEFVRSMRSQLSAYPVTTTPASVPTTPGVAVPDIQLDAQLPGGKTIQVNVLLVDNVSTAPAAFYARYEGLSTRADLIAYNGHAGLGQNVRALARKGGWVQGQYVIVFMNGCDTYAYVDGSLAETRAAVNPDDPSGSKYMEFVVNAMPAYFSSDAGATMALVRGLLRTEDPMTYERMFANIDRAQVVLVTGEQDNVYVPGGGGGGEFTPVREQTSAAQGQTLAFSTAMAPAGKYVVKLAHDTAHPGGDADVYVRVGAAPTESTYDCRPYDDGSNELCAVTLAAPARIFVNVKGYAAGENHFVLTIDRDGATPPPGTWTGIDESGTVTKSQEKRWQTPSLPAGAYLFQITGQGDADLYVRTGVAPTTSSYECRPYKSGSNESCLVNLTVPAPIHVMVRGYAASSSFRLVGKVQ